MSEHNTQLPTSGMLCGKPKWKVYKAGRYAWCAHRKGELPAVEGLFRTWREAMNYADHMARSLPVEIVAPHYRYKTRFKMVESDKRLLGIIALHYQQEVGE